MANKHGDFIWYELMTPDPSAAKTFYEAVVGWKITTDAPGDMDYHMISAGDNHVGGVMPLTDEMCSNGARPVWMGYVGVDDVDASLEKLKSLGGSELMPARDIPGVGRIAMVADPQGIPFYIMRGAVVDGTSLAFKANTIGHCVWNELTTPDQASSWAFYGELFGWENRETMSMGDLGDYQFIFQHEERIGAISPFVEEQSAPLWTYYFNVPSITTAIERINTMGGKILTGPHEVPGDDYIIIGIDPDGAMFALAGKLE